MIAVLWSCVCFATDADLESEINEVLVEEHLTQQLRVRSRPGSRFVYSNMGYTLLGMLIESVTDDRYEIFLDEHVLVPLAMYDSTFAFTTQEGEDADPKLALGHVDDGSRYAATPIFLRPAGQFTTTTADLARFAEFLLGDGVIDGRTFIDKSFMASRARPRSTEAANAGLIAGYSLGMGRRDRHGVVGYCRNGSCPRTPMVCGIAGEWHVAVQTLGVIYS